MFRMALNKLKVKMGCMVHEECILDGNKVEDNKQHFQGETVTIGGKYSAEDTKSTNQEQGWMPIHTILQWTDM